MDRASVLFVRKTVQSNLMATFRNLVGSVTCPDACLELSLQAKHFSQNNNLIPARNFIGTPSWAAYHRQAGGPSFTDAVRALNILTVLRETFRQMIMNFRVVWDFDAYPLMPLTILQDHSTACAIYWPSASRHFNDHHSFARFQDPCPADHADGNLINKGEARCFRNRLSTDSRNWRPIVLYRRTQWWKP